jgi:uncharacterized protein
LKSLQQYSIPFTGLKTGIHHFRFDVDNLFFSSFEYSLVKSGNLKVDLELEKQETMMILNFEIVGEMKLSCDVCLADYPYQVKINERQIAKFSNYAELEDDTEEIIILTRNETEINIATLIYEYINLAVPFINRCGDEGNTEWCDQGMIETLKQFSGGSNEENVDPRWSALKNIKK